MKFFETGIDKKEIRLIAIISFVLIIITLVPVLYAYFFAPSGMYYTGRHAQNSGDVAVYFSQIEQARQGHLLFENLYTSEFQRRIIFNPFWLVLGLLGRLFNLSNIFIFQLVRVLLIPIFVFTSYLLVSYFFQSKLKRIIGILLICFAGGITHYAYTIDGSSFPSLSFSPHLVLSLILIELIFLLILISWQTDKIKLAIIAGILALILFSFHPYHITTVLGILGIYLLVLIYKNYRRLLSYINKYLVLLIFSLPAILYYYWYFRADKIARIWLEQSDKLMHPRPPWEILYSLGFLSILAIVGLYFYLKNKKNKFPLVWVVGSLSLFWIPLFFRMRLIGGLSIALSILAVEAIYYIVKYLKTKKYFYITITLFCFLCLSLLIPVNLSIVLQNIAVYYQKVPLAYIKLTEKESLDWIRNNLNDNDVILASWVDGFGNLIPGYTGKKVFVGHGIQTPKAEEKWEMVRWFFRDGNQEGKTEFLKNNNIGYIFYSQYEKELGNYNVEGLDYLKKVFENKDVSIFKVKINAENK